ncbi:AAA family ATPase [Oceanispirochaeta sp.]|jgi:MoxR-like ATPase|uniref:AAA family ATPase n=1 Tax=Oceanispirochaeta sp. TaxID=2035350 RepID=UPI00261D6A5E|nr:AAA family ATPase [Oceanispirochaeta sp.]MDA3956764.1 AAA family ATPase [Oceanispirochaeta sp.]
MINQIQNLPESCTKIITAVQDEMAKVIVGQKTVLDRMIIGLICNQHILLEGVPGLAKTLIVTTLAKIISLESSRIQFTPDLLPADLTGTMIYNPGKGEFYSRKGPIFTNILLADEVNRAPAKVQSALLEAMQERQVTIGDETFPLDDPFMVLATQNPVEQEGTYPLPEAQVDRFMLKVLVDYPERIEELAILRSQKNISAPEMVHPVCSVADIRALRQMTDELYMDPRLEEYIIDIVQATRYPAKWNLEFANFIQIGASPRASIFLSQAARAMALLRGRSYVTPGDIKEIAPDVLRHRIIITYEAEAEGRDSDWIIRKILETLAVV